MYEWGHKAREEYLRDYDVIQKELANLRPADERGRELERLADFLCNVAEAWDAASQEHRNKLRCLDIERSQAGPEWCTKLLSVAQDSASRNASLKLAEVSAKDSGRWLTKRSAPLIILHCLRRVSRGLKLRHLDMRVYAAASEWCTATS